MKLRFAPRALKDIESIADYLKDRSPNAAPKVRDALLASLRTLQDFPRSGRTQSVPGVRKFVASRFAYLIYYTVDEAAQEVVILICQHPSREHKFEDR